MKHTDFLPLPVDKSVEGTSARVAASLKNTATFLGARVEILPLGRHWGTTRPRSLILNMLSSSRVCMDIQPSFALSQSKRYCSKIDEGKQSSLFATAIQMSPRVASDAISNGAFVPFGRRTAHWMVKAR